MWCNTCTTHFTTKQSVYFFANKLRHRIDNIYEFKIITMSTMKFTWNEDTLDHFKFMSSYATKSEVQKEVQEFVEIDCHLEDGETEEMLVNDLMNQIYS